MLFNSFPCQSVPHILLLKTRVCFQWSLKKQKNVVASNVNLFGLGPETILDFVLIDHRNSSSKPEKIDTTLKNSKVAPEKLDMYQGTD